MRKLFSVLSILVVCIIVCFSSISVSAASKNSPVATTAPYDVNSGNGANNGTGDATTSPVTGDYVVYSVFVATGLGLSSLFAYKKYSSKKK